MTLGLPGQRGFVLVATVWVLAALMVLADYIAGVASADRERAHQAKQALQDDLDARATEATLLYLLATGRMNYRGLVLERQQHFQDLEAPRALPPGDGVVAAAGEAYAGLGRIRFSVQDESGLASVNQPMTVSFRAALLHAGVASLDIALLRARLRDYIDRDGTLSLNGAERSGYERAGLAPPGNWFLASPVELRKVLGASAAVPEDQWPRLRRITTGTITNGVNVNTMPLELLTALFDGDEAAARRVAAFREQQPLTSVEVAGVASGLPWPLVGGFSPLPSKRLRLAFWREGGGARTLVGVALTPGSTYGPWRKEYRYFEPAIGGAEPVREAATPLFQST